MQSPPPPLPPPLPPLTASLYTSRHFPVLPSRPQGSIQNDLHHKQKYHDRPCQPDGVNRFSSRILCEISAMIRASLSLSHGTPDSLAWSRNCCLSSISLATLRCSVVRVCFERANKPRPKAVTTVGLTLETLRTARIIVDNDKAGSSRL